MNKLTKGLTFPRYSGDLEKHKLDTNKVMSELTQRISDMSNQNLSTEDRLYLADILSGITKVEYLKQSLKMTILHTLTKDILIPIPTDELFNEV